MAFERPVASNYPAHEIRTHQTLESKVQLADYRGFGDVALDFIANLVFVDCDGVGATARGRTIHVGSESDIRSLSKAAQIANNGDTVAVASVDCRADVAVWNQSDLVIRGVGGRPRLLANGASAESKAIFVVRRDRVRIENLAFHGARVPDRNGAGIRLEKERLEIASCHFEDNENGILTGNYSRSS